MRLSLDDVLRATGGRPAGSGAGVFDSYHTDSREVRPGGLFFALRGAEMDGHLFAAAAAAAGAAGVVVERPVGLPGVAEVVVDDAWRALYDLAAAVRAAVDPLVVGVTGSNGKTSTREMTAAVLGRRYRVLSSQRNLNTETGVPLTLLGLEPGHTAAVVEMACQGPGQIAPLARLARPRAGIVTLVGSAHLEFFADRDQLARTKAELVEELPADGLAVLNAADDYIELLRAATRAPVVTFGMGAGDLQGLGYRPEGEGCAFEVEGVEVRLALSGRHQAGNALAAIAVGGWAGVPLDEAADALAGVRVEHRLQARHGPNGSRLLDDAYNASPESMLAAFEVAAEQPVSGRRLALLGEMLELGESAASAHEEVGRAAARVFDRVAVVDSGWGAALAAAAGADLLPDVDAASAWIRAEAGPGDLVLVKASNGVGLGRVAEEAGS